MGADRSRFLKRLAAAGTVAAIALVGATSSAWADDAARNGDAAPVPPIKAPKTMKMDEPMPGEMKKEGMMKGDVRKAAERKQRALKDAMEKEQKTMEAKPTPPAQGLK